MKSIDSHFFQSFDDIDDCQHSCKETIYFFLTTVSLPAYGEDSSLSALTFIPPICIKYQFIRNCKTEMRKLTGDSNKSFSAGEISDMNEGIIPSCKDVGYCKNKVLLLRVEDLIELLSFLHLLLLLVASWTLSLTSQTIVMSTKIALNYKTNENTILVI